VALLLVWLPGHAKGVAVAVAVAGLWIQDSRFQIP